MSKFTEGPWDVDHDGNSRPIIFTANRKMLSISQFSDGRFGSYENEEADARLIAIAPEMLAALQAVMQWASEAGDHGGNPYCKKFVQLAEKVIEKVQGDSKGE